MSSASSRFFQSNQKAAREYLHSNRFLQKIKHWMEHHPIASNSLLCFNLWIAGDVLAQYSEHRMLQDQQKNNVNSTTNNGKETAKVTQDRHDPETSFTRNYSPRRTAECASVSSYFFLLC